MATPDEIRAEIVARLQSVANIGVVHDHEPYAADLKTLKSLYVSEIGGESVMRGFFVQRTARERTAPSSSRRQVVHEWRIRGYMALSEEAGSELAFDALLEALCAAFDANEDYSFGLNLDTVVDEMAGLQVTQITPGLFAGVLCHMAECRLLTRFYA